ncbi:MAG: hypothetical protein IAG10_12185 [Planctomycetaceae bacterium]|nr:hypothetical protein [Planctomycetaceae bacterium]
MNPMPDPVIDEIREIRHRISAMCDHDPAKLVAYFQQIQEQYRDRLITSPRFAPPTAAQVGQADTNKADVLASQV